MPLSNAKTVEQKPRAVVTLTTHPLAESLPATFRRLGWQVFEAHSGEETRKLAHHMRPEAVVISTRLSDESGWLICDKLTRDLPGLKVILVGEEPQSSDEDFALFVGAVAVLGDSETPQRIVEEVSALRPYFVA